MAESTARTVAEELVDAFRPLGEVSDRRMFGGHGIFESGIMFAAVDSKGVAYLRVDEATREAYEHAGSHGFARMPYMSIPRDVLEDEALLLDRGREALEVARAARMVKTGRR